MKIIQEIVYGTVIGYVFFSWARKERKKDAEQIHALPPYLQSQASVTDSKVSPR